MYFDTNEDILNTKQNYTIQNVQMIIINISAHSKLQYTGSKR